MSSDECADLADAIVITSDSVAWGVSSTCESLCVLEPVWIDR